MTLDGAFSHLSELTTSRLCLRPMKLSDAGPIFAFKSDPKVTLCYGQEPHARIDETMDWLRKRLNDPRARDSLFWVITMKGDDTAIGECCFWNFDPSFHSAEIGYELHSDHWNKGIMTEALTEILAFGFLEMELHRIEACPYDNNTQSQKVLQKLGFRQEGRLRERHFFRGLYEDQLYFGLLRAEWKERKDEL